jgi:hypothetical protein
MKTPKLTTDNVKIPPPVPQLVKTLTSIYAYIDLISKMDIRAADDDLLNLYGLSSGSMMTVTHTGDEIKEHVKKATGQDFKRSLQEFAFSLILRKVSVQLNYLYEVCRSSSNTLQSNYDPLTFLPVCCPTTDLITRSRELQNIIFKSAFSKLETTDVGDVIAPWIHMIEAQASGRYTDTVETIHRTHVDDIIKTFGAVLHRCTTLTTYDTERQTLINQQLVLRGALALTCMVTGCHPHAITRHYGKLFTYNGFEDLHVSDIGLACLPVVTLDSLKVITIPNKHMVSTSSGIRYARASCGLLW